MEPSSASMVPLIWLVEEVQVLGMYSFSVLEFQNLINYYFHTLTRLKKRQIKFLFPNDD